MKKHLLSLFALAGMVFASSCTSEEIISQSTGNEVKVTFTTELRNDVKSRTVGEDTDNIDQLIFAVYDETGKELRDLRQSTHMNEDGAEKAILLEENGNKKKATIEVTLVKGQTYSFAFWAQKKGFSAYTFNPTTADVTVNYANRTANQREADAFFKGITNHKVTGTFTMDVTLKRPFAQVNFLTSQQDIIDARKAGFDVKESSIKVKNVAKTLNVLTGEVSNFENTEVTFGFANLLRDDQNLIETTKIAGDAVNDWRYLATAYFLPQKATAETQINAIMQIKAADTKKATTEIVATDITAQRNYRTNIYGNLLTSTGTFNVVVDPYFEDDDHNVQSGVYDVTSSSLSALLATNKDMEGDLVYNVSGLSETDNVTVEIPSGTKASSLTLNFTDTKDGSNMTVKDATSDEYAGTVVIKNPADKIVSELTVGLPEAHVYLAQGNYTKVTASTSSSTLVIGGGATVGTLTVDKGHVRVEEGGDITTIERGDENPDPVTYVAFESEEDIPEVANEDSEISYVSSTEFDLTAAIAEGGEVKLTMDVELKEPLVIAKGIETIIDLNGFTISQTNEQTGTYSMIQNNGTLIIKDTKGGGKIAYADNAELTADVNYVSNTISNSGTLTIEDGIIENNSTEKVADYGYPHPIDNSGVLTINGGTIANKSNYSSMRIWCTTDDNTIVTINGGTFEGSIDFHNVNGSANKGTLTINDGTFNADEHCGCAVRLLGFGTDVDEMNGYITGGTFNGKILLKNYTGSGEFNSQVFFISGGTFAEDPSDFLADGYLAKEENGIYKIVEDAVVKIGNTTYPTLMKAIEAVNNGGTITLLKDVTFTEKNRINNGGWYEGLLYDGDKSFTLDLNDKTITNDKYVNDYLLYFKNNGDKANTITIKNGTITAGSSAYAAIATASSNTQKITMNLEDVSINGNNSNGAVVKFRGGGELNVKAGTTITGKDSYVGIEVVGTETVANIYEGVEIYQNGTTSYVGAIAGVNYNATLNVYGGKGVSAKCGLIVMTSGGTINVEGGEWTANTDGTPKDDNLGVLVSQFDNATYPTAISSVINVTGGTFKGGYNCYGNVAGKAFINISGGNFNANPTKYLADGYKAVENSGIYNIEVDPAAKIGSTEYATLQEAFNAGGEITLLRDVKLAETIVIETGKTATIDLDGYAITSGFQPNNNTKHIYPFDVYGNLTIKDSGEEGSITGRGIYVQDGAKLIVKGGSINGIDSNGGSALFQYGGDIIIDGGHIEQQAEGTTNFAINAASGTVTVNNGWIGGNHGAIAAVGAQVTIHNGEFVCTGTDGMTDNVVYSNGEGSITINGGIFTADGDVSAGGACVYDANGKVIINGGSFGNSSGGDVWGTTGTTIQGGTFANLTETSRIVEGYEAVKNEDGTSTVKAISGETM